MGELRSQDKRDKLRLIYARTTAGGTSGGGLLKDLLMAGLSASDAAISGPTPGTFLSETLEAGGRAYFQELKTFTPHEAKRLFGELLDLYDWVIAQGAVTADADVFPAMMSALKPIRRYRGDYTGLRYGIGFQLGGN